MTAPSLEWRIKDQGHALVQCPRGSIEEAQEYLMGLMTEFSDPIHVFKRHPFWKPIGVNASRPQGRSEGTGLNSLHIDCISSSRPPDYVVLLCIVRDPNGGGDSLICKAENAWPQLSRETRKCLTQSFIPAEPTYDLEEVGPGLSEYTITPDDLFFRYSGRYLDDYGFSGEQRAALLELDRVLMLGAIRIGLLSMGRAHR